MARHVARALPQSAGVMICRRDVDGACSDKIERKYEVLRFAGPRQSLGVNRDRFAHAANFREQFQGNNSKAIVSIVETINTEPSYAFIRGSLKICELAVITPIKRANYFGKEISSCVLLHSSPVPLWLLEW